MKLFESKQIKKLTEATLEELQQPMDEIKSALEKIVDVKKHTLNIGMQKIMGDPYIKVLFLKYQEKDKKWASGITLNDPALVNLMIEQNANGTFTAETAGHTAYGNHKRSGVGNMVKKTGTLPQLIKHLENYFKKLVSNINDENYESR